MRNFSFFVDVSGLGLSGLVHLSSIEDDFYVFDAARNHLVGRRTRRVIQLGEKLTVQVSKVDTFKKQVDFRLADSLSKKKKPGSAGTSPGDRKQGRQSRQNPGRARNQPPIAEVQE